MPMGPSDEAVLRDWVERRESGAFRIAVSRYAGMVYGTCRRIMGNESDAEEVAQECFEALAEAPGRDRPRELGSWLHGVAVNKSMSRLRAEGRRRSRESEYASAQSAHGTAPAWNDVYDLVDEAVAGLPEELRVPLVYQFLCGYSHGKIARGTGVPRRTVSRRISKGLELVAEFLQKRGVHGTVVGLVAVIASGLAEAVPVPASLTASLGKLALGLVRVHPAAVSVAGAATAIVAVKWIAALAAVAVVAAIGVAANEAISPSSDRHPPRQAQATMETTPTSAAAPAQEAGPPSQDTEPAVSGPTGTISGRVTDATMTREKMEIFFEFIRKPPTKEAEDALQKRAEKLSTPWPNVEVVLGSYADEGMGRKLQSALSDKDGRYTFTEVPPGDYTMWINPPPEACPADDARFDKVRKLRIKPGTTTTADFKLREGVRVAGQVTDRSAKAVAGAEVVVAPIATVFMDQDYARVEEKSQVAALTEQDGRYIIERVVPANIKDAIGLVARGKNSGGVVQITARAKGYAASRVFTYAMSLAQVADAKVLMKKFQSESKDVRQSLPSVPPDSLPLAPYENGTLMGLDLKLDPAATVSGMLLTTQGRPMPRAKLKMILVEDEPPLSPVMDGQTENEVQGKVVHFTGKPFAQYRVPPEPVETDDAGKFCLDGLSAGAYSFEVEMEDGKKQAARNQPLTLAMGQRLSDIKVIVEDPEDRLTLVGCVVDAATRQPIGDFNVWLNKIESPRESNPQMGEYRKDEIRKGTFSITGMSPGTAELNITDAPGYGSERFIVDLKREAGREATFALAREAKITGRVLVNGEPREMQVGARNVEGYPDIYAGSDKSTGEYQLKGLKPGEYIVGTYLNLEGLTGMTQRALRETVVLESGKTAQVDFNFSGSATVQGTCRIPRGLDGFIRILYGWPDPVPETGSAEESEMWAAGAWDFRSSDRYQIANMSAGEFTVIGALTKREEGKVVTLEREAHKVTLRDAETIELDFDFSDYAPEQE